MIRVLTATAVLIALAGAGSARAAELQQVGTFDQPIYVTSDPSNPDRLFVAEREGKIKEMRGGATAVVVDLSPIVSCCAGEQGLMSIAMSPDFATSGRIYAYYSGLEGEVHVSEMVAGAPISALREVLKIPHPEETNHYGGQLQFGPDNLLYISTGDGGGQNGEHGHAQDTASLLGKVLRIDPRPAGALQYSIPVGNPFGNEVWSLGLRNPYRFSFDRESGAIVIGDVGQGQREEVDYAAAPAAGYGANFGWNCREGSIGGPSEAEPECATLPFSAFTNSIFDYTHDSAGESRCAIVGGYVVHDPNLGDLNGRYLYGDYCGQQLRSFQLATPYSTDRAEGIPISQLTSFGEDACGRIYTVQETGRVAMLVGAGGVNSCPGTTTPKKRAFSVIGIKATRGKRVLKGKRAQITAWVSPCAGRKGEPVKLMRGAKHLGTRRLDRACTVRFRPKITRRANFRATISEDANYVSATSRKLRIKVAHKKKAAKRKRAAARG